MFMVQVSAKAVRYAASARPNRGKSSLVVRRTIWPHGTAYVLCGPRWPRPARFRARDARLTRRARKPGSGLRQVHEEDRLGRRQRRPTVRLVGHRELLGVAGARDDLRAVVAL